MMKCRRDIMVLICFTILLVGCDRALPSEQVGAIHADILALEKCLTGVSGSAEEVVTLQNSIVDTVGTLTNKVERSSCARAYAKFVLTVRLPDHGKIPTSPDVVSKRYFDSVGSAYSALNLARCDGREKMEFCLAALSRLRDYCLSPLKNFKTSEKNAILNLFIAYDNEMSCWNNAYLPAILKTLPEDLHQEFTKRSHEIVSRPSIEEVRSLCR